MVCTSCRGELPLDATACPHCGAAVTEPPRDAGPNPDIDLVPVFGTADPVAMPLAKSLLDAEGIEYFVRGEGLQDLFGGGRIGLGYNVVVGPAEILVRAEDADRARELVGAMTVAEPSPEPEDAGEEPRRSR